MKKLICLLLAFLAMSTFAISSVSATTYELNSYGLLDNIPLYSWDASYEDYRCYAYALRRTSGEYWPGYFSTYQNHDDFSTDIPIYSMALAVKNDLKSSELNYACVKVTDTLPNTLNAARYNYICIRKSIEDFHFMRYDGTYWSHKPGKSIPLRYTGTFSNDIPWKLQGVTAAGAAVFENEYYDYNSKIYYIIFRRTHYSTTYAMTGNNYHSGSNHYYEYGYKCTDCGVFVGETTWESVPCRGGNLCVEPWSLRDEPLAA